MATRAIHPAPFDGTLCHPGVGQHRVDLTCQAASFHNRRFNSAWFAQHMLL